MARAATNPLLAEAFNAHLEETQGQIERIDQLVALTGLKLKRMKCVAMEGLVEESKELLEELEKGAVLDAGLIDAAQKVEHYEIASYGTLIVSVRQTHLDHTILPRAPQNHAHLQGFSKRLVKSPWFGILA